MEGDSSSILQLHLLTEITRLYLQVEQVHQSERAHEGVSAGCGRSEEEETD